ncbi:MULTISPECIES: hypothetical protein [Cohaesibacter]|uniref:hypothetical protein n=1 Tax=Cohaesibacter TaxID=655352 RepID=UPI0013009BE8|nr:MULTISPECIES: hypothetical protein [Cohaesibacter]
MADFLRDKSADSVDFVGHSGQEVAAWQCGDLLNQRAVLQQKAPCKLLQRAAC